MASGVVLGLNAFTAINSGTTAAPVYEELKNIRDETLNMETALSDITTRAANGWRMQVGTLSDANVTGQMVYQANAADAQFDLIQAAFISREKLLMAFLDDDPASTPVAEQVSGLAGGFGVTNFTTNRQLEEAMIVDVSFTAREDDEGNGPDWISIAGQAAP